ncbi:metal ABC transporter ATP-binding protein [Methanohalophilus sp.]|uniref:metal ABC transporter ATP-binding protein n=1 Tax=Methanohalophilus sp. TaxID=1966352 RepID=UPI00261569D1|nr:metal ABC transporter ATP-binding protein [Methanohalophilus sp.]MDK2893058.1 zinc transport system ATP-binding protein [Methanohalophilus sp.]
MEEVIDIRNVSVYYGSDSIPALKEVNLKVFRGDFLGIIGPNGGGKSTLLKVLLGLIKPDSGDVRVFGEEPAKARKYIGYVPQKSAYQPDFPVSVREVVLMGRLGKHMLLKNYSQKDLEAVDNALQKVKMLDFKNRQISELSGGQQQRVFIARALVREPEILLLDEPVSGIDEMMQKEFYEILTDLKSKVTIIMVSHDLTAISNYVDKIACLNQTLFFHGSKEIPESDLKQAYCCPVELIAHGIPHRVLKEH